MYGSGILKELSSQPGWLLPAGLFASMSTSDLIHHLDHCSSVTMPSGQPCAIGAAVPSRVLPEADRDAGWQSAYMRQSFSLLNYLSFYHRAAA